MNYLRIRSFLLGSFLINATFGKESSTEDRNIFGAVSLLENKVGILEQHPDTTRTTTRQLKSAKGYKASKSSKSKSIKSAGPKSSKSAKSVKNAKGTKTDKGKKISKTNKDSKTKGNDTEKVEVRKAQPTR